MNSVQTEEQRGFMYIIKSLQQLIHDESLNAGDKLPSERYLATTLNVGRSSIREALRALELIGVIEVRRGEGTYLCHIEDHQLFEIIAQFLIHSDEQRTNILEIQEVFRRYIAQEMNIKEGDLNVAKETLFNYDNDLMIRIYSLLDQYIETFDKGENEHGND